MRQRSHQPGPGGDDGRTHQGAVGGNTGSDAGIPQARAVQDIAALPNLIPTIVKYDRERREYVFNKTPNECGVCLNGKFGSDCIKFDACGHVYCKECMKEHFSVKIRDGDVKGLFCPDIDCESVALPSQVSLKKYLLNT